MLKWKTKKFLTIANNVESLENLLAGAAGKGRVLKFITGTNDADIYLRVYRDAEQCVDIECSLLLAGAPLMPVDIPLADGQILNVGFYNVSAGNVTPSITIGYEETG